MDRLLEQERNIQSKARLVQNSEQQYNGYLERIQKERFLILTALTNWAATPEPLALHETLACHIKP